MSIGLDNGPAFVAEVVQLVAKGLGITWKLHLAYCPQSSGKVEHMNRTLKLQLGKLCQETHIVGSVTTYIISKDQVKPHEVDRAFAFEVLYGYSSHLIKGI
jgi:transposase InsO family protein